MQIESPVPIGLSTPHTPANMNTLRSLGLERSPSPTLTSLSTGGFSFGRKTRGFWDKPANTIMRNNIIMHSTAPITGLAGSHTAPGPGTYNVGRRAKEGPNFTLRGKLPSKAFILPNTPSPTQYSPDKRVLSPVRRAPAFTFGGRPRDRAESGVPGPGHYGAPSDRGTSKSGVTPACSLAPRCGKSAIEPHLMSPGPATHNPLHGDALSSGFSFGLRTESSLRSVLKDGVLMHDVHELEPMTPDPKRSSMSTSRKSFIASKIPGPGAYEVHSPRHGPRYSIGTRTSLDNRQLAMNTYKGSPDREHEPQLGNRTDSWVLPRSFSPPPRATQSNVPGAVPLHTSIPMVPSPGPRIPPGPTPQPPAPAPPAPPMPPAPFTSSVSFAPEPPAASRASPTPYARYGDRPISGRPVSGRPVSGRSVPDASSNASARPVSGRPLSGRPDSATSRPDSAASTRPISAAVGRALESTVE